MAADSGLEKRLQALLDDAATEATVASVAAAVHAPRLGVRWIAGAGRRHLDGDVEPVDPRQPFRIASITKVMTAAAVLRLVEQGRLVLGATIDRLASAATVAQLAGGGYAPDRIALSHLLTHTSGLVDHGASDSFAATIVGDPRHRWTRAEQVALAMSLGPPRSPPGAAYAYSDTGYIVVGEIVERATSMALGPAVRALLGFDALGLAHTHWERDEADPQPALGRMPQYQGDVETSGFDPSFDLYGGGGLVSTVEDLASFAAALFRGRVFERPETLAAALIVPPAARQASDRLHSRVAYVIPFGSNLAWGHTGHWGSSMACCPDLDLAVAVTLNQGALATPQRHLALTQALLAELAGEPERY